MVGRGKGLVLAPTFCCIRKAEKNEANQICARRFIYVYLCGHLDSKMRGILLKSTKIETALQKFSKEFGSTTLEIPGVNEGLGLDSLSKNITSLVLTRLVRWGWQHDTPWYLGSAECFTSRSFCQGDAGAVCCLNVVIWYWLTYIPNITLYYFQYGDGFDISYDLDICI